MTRPELERTVNAIACRFHGQQGNVGIDRQTYHFMDHLSASQFISGVQKVNATNVVFQRSGRDKTVVHVHYRF